MLLLRRANDDSNGPASDGFPALVGVERSSHLGIETVATGSESIRTAIVDAASGTLLTCDATHDRHLEAIARAGRRLDRRPLYAESADLARYVSVPGEPDGEPLRIAGGGHGSALGIVGSVSERPSVRLARSPRSG